MPQYVYQAKKDSLHTVTGEVKAENVDEAIDLVHQLGLVPVTVQLAGESNISSGNQARPRTIRARDVALFSRQVSGLLKSGVPLLKALEVISTQTKQAYFAQVILDIAQGIKSGRALSHCLSDYPLIFSSLYIAMVKAGEEMGQLKMMLLNLAAHLKEQEEMSLKVKQALVYPMVMVILGIGTVIFVLTFVMPKVAAMFTHMQQTLPWPTKVVMTLSHFLIQAGWPALLGVSFGILLFLRWRQTLAGQAALSRLSWYVPMVRTLLLKADLARFTRTLQLLLSSGVTVVRGMQTALPTISHPALREQLAQAIGRIIGGEGLGRAIEGISWIDPMVKGQITVAEESGHLSEALGDIAESYERDVANVTKTISVLIEPLMMVGVGALIAFIVFAMLMPIFSMDLMAQ